MNRKPLIKIDTQSGVSTNDDLAGIFDVGIHKKKAILATFTSLGWEVEAIHNLKRDYVCDLIKKAMKTRLNLFTSTINSVDRRFTVRRVLASLVR